MTVKIISCKCSLNYVMFIFFHKIFSTLLDFLFPREKFELEMENMSVDEIYNKAKRENSSLSRKNTIPSSPAVILVHTGIHSIFCYKASFVKNLIELVKYRGNKKVIDKCGEILYREITKIYGFDDAGTKKFTLIPIPSSNKRRREKGFNQCELLCEAVLKNNPDLFDYQKKVLIKTKHVISQTKLKRKERLKNLTGSMFIKNPELIKDKEIILIDDVWTTGATTNEAIRVLREVGVKKVFVFTLAH